MSSCLGIYIDKNLIKYAKVKKVKDSFKIEAFNVEVFEDLEESLKKVIKETNSEKSLICINISNELYNYFEVFSVLEKKDITKSLRIEFEMLCDEKGYDQKSLESRYILMENKENFEKYKSMYISANKEEIEKRLKMLSDYKTYSITPVSTSITNLIEYDGNENVAIINIENETKITTIIDGQINRVDILKSGMEDVVEKVNKIELSWKKAYDVFKNITIYGREVQSLDENENEYLEIVMPVVYKIASETKKTFNSFKQKIDKVYITGMGAAINNIDLYFQDFLKDIKCEILKPFFIESNSLKIPTKEYIEVNSAIALALEGLGFLNKNLNFAPNSKFDNLENIKSVKENFDIKNLKEIFKGPLDIKEKLISRVIAAFAIGIVGFSCFGFGIINQIDKQKTEINKCLALTNAKISNMDTELSQIESHTNVYKSLINDVDSLNEPTLINRNNRVISKRAIPNLLNKLMFIKHKVSQDVKIISIENTKDKHIVIEASSEDYEQLGYLVAGIEDDGMLQNVKSTSVTKDNSISQITIEGDLP